MTRPPRLVLSSGSYRHDDIELLLEPVGAEVDELGIAQREAAMAAGRHYAEMLPLEAPPTPEYLAVVDRTMAVLAAETAVLVARVAEQVARLHADVVLASVARGGCPAGVLVHRYLRSQLGIVVPHVGVSVIKGRGLDPAARAHIARRWADRQVVMIDGWTSKGLIADEVDREGSVLAALVDPAGRAHITGTRQDRLVPSACLNALSHGMLSRTVRSTEPGVRFDAVRVYRPSAGDRTNHFLDLVSQYFGTPGAAAPADADREDVARTSHVAIARAASDWGQGEPSRIRPGVGETLRVLLRRAPRVVVVRDLADVHVAPVITLAVERDVAVEEVPSLPWRSLAVLARGAGVACGAPQVRPLSNRHGTKAKGDSAR